MINIVLFANLILTVAEAKAVCLSTGGEKSIVTNEAHVFDGIESLRIKFLD